MKKWAKRLLVVAGLWLLAIASFWQYGSYRDGAKLKSIRAHLDEAEPGWRLDDLVAKRNANLPPDDRNVATIALAALKTVPDEFEKWSATDAANWREELILGHLADPADLAETKENLKGLGRCLGKLHEIRKHSRGGVILVFPEPNPMDIVLTETQKMRMAASVLSWQVLIAANDNDPDTALEAARTSAHLRHAIGDEPTIISQIVRVALTANAVRSTEQTLALTEPKTGLAELQADFEKALTEHFIIGGVEGERATSDRIMENLANGKLGEYAGLGRGGNGGFLSTLNNSASNRNFRSNHVALLEISTAMLHAMRKPRPERKKAMDAVPIPKDGEATATNFYAVMIAYQIEKIIEIESRNEATLGCAILALACERFRIANGRWPNDLAEIPKSILAAIPDDPFTGNPLLMKRTDTGLVIYSTGKDGIDDGGEVLDPKMEPGTDLGFRLFDPAHHRKPVPETPIPPAENP